MRARVAKWGNSLAVRIPKTAAEQAGLDEGVEVEIRVSGHNLVLRAARPRYSLDELVNGITPANRHGETAWGPPKGRETW